MLQGNQRLFYAMEQGKPLSECLIEGHSEPFYEHLSFFLKITSLPNAILSALSIDDISKQFKYKLLKEMSHPMFFYLLSFFMLTMLT